MAERKREHKAPPGYVTRKEAVAEGWFTSEKQAATLASERRGPPYYRPSGGPAYYRRDDLAVWWEKGRVLTEDFLKC